MIWYFRQKIDNDMQKEIKWYMTLIITEAKHTPANKIFVNRNQIDNKYSL